MSVKSILLEHAQRYPVWELADIYKLLHQATLGAEHAVADETEARNWLIRELADLGPGPEEPLVDPISPDGQIVRVHLRPFTALRFEADDLFQAFIRTAAEVPPATTRLDKLAVAAIELAGEGRLPCSGPEAERYFAERHIGGYPPAHHSERFKRLHKPAYRVVARRFLPEIVLKAAS